MVHAPVVEARDPAVPMLDPPLHSLRSIIFTYFLNTFINFKNV